MLIDTHAHLNDSRLTPYVDDIVNFMEQDGLWAIINVGYDIVSSADSVRLAEQYSNVYAAVGIHPHDAKIANDEAYEYLVKAGGYNKVVAIGEIGLDYYYDYSPRDIQRKVFIEQLELADTLKLPVIIHLRDAYQDMYDLLKQNKEKLNNGLVMHCYSGSLEMAKLYNEFDCYYSFGGAVTFSKYKDIIVREIPKDRLMLETDCPYMTPAPFRGKTNFPKYTALVRDKIAEFLNLSVEQVEEITNNNARRLFRRLI